jgi:hypothetical protein
MAAAGYIPAAAVRSSAGPVLGPAFFCVSCVGLCGPVCCVRSLGTGGLCSGLRRPPSGLCGHVAACVVLCCGPVALCCVLCVRPVGLWSVGLWPVVCAVFCVFRVRSVVVFLLGWRGPVCAVSVGLAFMAWTVETFCMFMLGRHLLSAACCRVRSWSRWGATLGGRATSVVQVAMA